MVILTTLISWVLLSVIVLGLIILIFLKPKMVLPYYERVFSWTVVLLVLHATHVLCCLSFFPSKRELDWAAPYGLLYAPMLYFAVKSDEGEVPLRWKTILLHSLFFSVAYLFYIYLIATGTSKYDPLFIWYADWMYRLMMAGFFVYGFWAWFFPHNVDSLPLRALMLQSVIMFVLMGLLFVATSATVDSQTSSDRYLPRLMIYIMMLVCMITLFRHKLSIVRYVDPYVEDRNLTRLPSNNNVSSEKDISTYGKSAIVEEKLIFYEQKIRALVEEEKAYLDPAFNLDMLSERLRIPSHHLSQVFSLQIKKSFTTYLGELRIEYAVQILKNNTEKMKLENLAYECGFNSKVSFNRHFKQLLGQSPSSFQKELLAKGA